MEGGIPFLLMIALRFNKSPFPPRQNHPTFPRLRRLARRGPCLGMAAARAWVAGNAAGDAHMGGRIGAKAPAATDCS